MKTMWAWLAAAALAAGCGAAGSGSGSRQNPDGTDVEEGLDDGGTHETPTDDGGVVSCLPDEEDEGDEGDGGDGDDADACPDDRDRDDRCRDDRDDRNDCDDCDDDDPCRDDREDRDDRDDDDDGDDDDDDDGEGPEPEETLGRMTGGGSVWTDDGMRVTHGFQLRCDADDDRQNLQVNWGGGNKFHLLDLVSATCLDTALDEENPVAGFDTFTATGTGRYNGDPGATIELTFTDDGEPGVDDTATMTLRDAGGNVVLEVSGELRHGNHQAHRAQ